jgi:hypothetical protein
VLLVGYDNAHQFWVAKNSWSPQFADSGFFRVRFGAAGVGNPSDTLGLRYAPGPGVSAPPPYGGRLEGPARRREAGCRVYRAAASDYVSKVAAAFGLPIQDVLFENRAVLPTPDMWLGGVALTLCGRLRPSNSSGGGGGSSGGGGNTSSPEPLAVPGGAAQQGLSSLQCTRSSAIRAPVWPVLHQPAPQPPPPSTQTASRAACPGSRR